MVEAGDGLEIASVRATRRPRMRAQDSERENLVRRETQIIVNTVVAWGWLLAGLVAFYSWFVIAVLTDDHIWFLAGVVGAIVLTLPGYVAARRNDELMSEAPDAD